MKTFPLLRLLCCFVSLTAANLVESKPRHFGEGHPLKLQFEASSDPLRTYDFEGISDIRGQKTGYFHTERIDGKWWLIDPNGDGFWMASLIGVRLGKFGFEDTEISNHLYFDSQDDYIAHVESELDAYEFNSLGFWSIEPYVGTRPFTRRVNADGFFNWDYKGSLEYKLVDGPAWHDLPNIFHPDFEDWIDREAELDLSAFRNSPWLIGVMVDNERDWFGKQLAGIIFRYPKAHYAKQALIEFSKNEFDAIDDFNKAWLTDFRDFDHLLENQIFGEFPPTEEAIAFAWKWQAYCLDRYLGTWHKALGKHLPNHMMMGIRQHNHDRKAAHSRSFWKTMAKYCDVLSINMYGDETIDLDFSESIREISELTERPIINSEWYPLGDPETSFTRYQSFMASNPYIVGSQFFNWNVMGHPELSLTDETFQVKDRSLQLTIAEVNRSIPTLRQRGQAEDYVEMKRVQKQFKPDLPKRLEESVSSKFALGSLLFTRISSGWKLENEGQTFGTLQPIIHQVDNGRAVYASAEKHEISAIYENADFLVIDSVLSRSEESQSSIDLGNGRRPGPDEYPSFSYEYRMRLWLSKELPHSFATQFLSLQNESERSWYFSSFMHSFRPLFGGNDQDDTPIDRSFGFAGWGDSEVDFFYGADSFDDRIAVEAIVVPSTGQRLSILQEPVDRLLVGAQSYSVSSPTAVVHWIFDKDTTVKTAAATRANLERRWFHQTEVEPIYESALAPY